VKAKAGGPLAIFLSAVCEGSLGLGIVPSPEFLFIFSVESWGAVLSSI